ncbi:hypothetical protein E5676_scaffold209G00230 [Cucumis melo var. makuwa]|nr:hypothetical protein E6C27_scaffold171G006700 [Cucumis melo var. makuwa]TYK16100.1 hypothetical protein E5676_scaffold209G00230 [Cucumis melo var. makuwa]
MSNYKLQLGDFVHATLSIAVFAVLVVLDSDTVRCFFPSLVAEDKLLVQVLPPVVGAVFVMFPNTRHGFGYHSTATSIGVQKAALS